VIDESSIQGLGKPLLVYKQSESPDQKQEMSKKA
jgi:hypothetical protein